MKINPELLEKIGLVLYGEHWKSGLSDALNLSSPRRMREWFNGERSIPQTILPELTKLLEDKIESASSLLKELKKEQ